MHITRSYMFLRFLALLTLTVLGFCSSLGAADHRVLAPENSQVDDDGVPFRQWIDQGCFVGQGEALFHANSQFTQTEREPLSSHFKNGATDCFAMTQIAGDLYVYLTRYAPGHRWSGSWSFPGGINRGRATMESGLKHFFHDSARTFRIPEKGEERLLLQNCRVVDSSNKHPSLKGTKCSLALIILPILPEKAALTAYNFMKSPGERRDNGEWVLLDDLLFECGSPANCEAIMVRKNCPELSMHCYDFGACKQKIVNFKMKPGGVFPFLAQNSVREAIGNAMAPYKFSKISDQARDEAPPAYGDLPPPYEP